VILFNWLFLFFKKRKRFRALLFSSSVEDEDEDEEHSDRIPNVCDRIQIRCDRIHFRCDCILNFFTKYEIDYFRALFSSSFSCLMCTVYWMVERPLNARWTPVERPLNARWNFFVSQMQQRCSVWNINLKILPKKTFSNYFLKFFWCRLIEPSPTAHWRWLFFCVRKWCI